MISLGLGIVAAASIGALVRGWNSDLLFPVGVVVVAMVVGELVHFVIEDERPRL